MAYAPYPREPTVCRDCGAVIGFVRNRDGSWFPVDIVCNPREPYGDYYLTGMGTTGTLPRDTSAARLTCPRRTRPR